jgi:rhodanese-related sulfurtransferase
MLYIWKNNFLMHRWLFLVLICFSCVSTPKNKSAMNQLSPTEWADVQQQTPESIILDVRTEEEFEDGYIAGALNFDIRGGAAFLDSLETLDKSKHYFVYCRSGARSAQACQLMGQMGFEFVYNLDGGVLAWEGDLEE